MDSPLIQDFEDGKFYVPGDIVRMRTGQVYILASRPDFKGWEPITEEQLKELEWQRLP